MSNYILKPNLSDENNKNILLVKDILDSFVKEGSSQKLLESLSEDAFLKLTIPSNTPLSGEFHGRERISDYFKKIDELLEIVTISISDYIAYKDKVIVLGYEKYQVKKNQKIFESEWATIFTIHQDKISKVLVIEDCSGLFEAYAK